MYADYNIGDEGAKALAEALKTNTALTTLTLGSARLPNSAAHQQHPCTACSCVLRTRLHLRGRRRLVGCACVVML